MICFPNAKVNIGLKITSKRKDGYHNIDSYFLPVPLFDVLELIPDYSLKKNKVTYSGCSIPNGGKNLIIRAYDLLNNDFKLPALKIHLHKNIPCGAGLGGGSSNAVFMLKALDLIFNLNISKKNFFKYCLNIGSDCPFFIFNTLSRVSGLGEKVKQLNNSPFRDYYIILIKSNIHCSTSTIFSKHKITQTTNTHLELNSDIYSWKEELRNDLESTVFSIYPELNTLKKYLYSIGAFYASMTGSGSTIFGLFTEMPKINQNNVNIIWAGKIK